MNYLYTIPNNINWKSISQMRGLNLQFYQIIYNILHQSDQWDAKFRTTPIIMNEDIKNDPPYERKGNGNPFTGMIPTVIAALTNTCANKIDAIPISIMLVKRSFTIYAN